jgi:glycerol-3-phosphate O-acyltransferase
MVKVPEVLDAIFTSGALTPEISEGMRRFYTSYAEAIAKGGKNPADYTAVFVNFLQLVGEHLKNPYQFHPYHEAIREPFDYYSLGLEFIRPLVDFKHSTVTGKDEIKKIEAALDRGENVILFSNHQTEIDPQLISLLLEKISPKLAQEMIFIAGHRVVIDPLATPMSLGRNLLCIYSKKYVDHPPEKKLEKLQHNQRTLKILEELLKQGGKCIYVAPSGGRDRADETGAIRVDPFNPDSIEMLHLIAQKSQSVVHFHTLALATYALLPPPKEIHIEIGELRSTDFKPAHLAFGKELDMERIGADGIELDKKEKRKHRADAIWQEVLKAYDQFPS